MNERGERKWAGKENSKKRKRWTNWLTHWAIDKQREYVWTTQKLTREFDRELQISEKFLRAYLHPKPLHISPGVDLLCNYKRNSFPLYFEQLCALCVKLSERVACLSLCGAEEHCASLCCLLRAQAVCEIPTWYNTEGAKILLSYIEYCLSQWWVQKSYEMKSGGFVVSQTQRLPVTPVDPWQCACTLGEKGECTHEQVCMICQRRAKCWRKVCNSATGSVHHIWGVSPSARPLPPSSRFFPVGRFEHLMVIHEPVVTTLVWGPVQSCSCDLRVLSGMCVREKEREK